jgi:simple sugar transport system ATP-binding protein
MSTETEPKAAQMPVVEVDDLRKHYGGTEALAGVSLRVQPREVLAIVGDNGAGKTTLIKLLSGVERPSSGAISIQGERVELRTTRDARVRGMETVHQNLALADHLPVWANMHLGREQLAPGIAGRLGLMNRKAMRRRAVEDLERLSVSLPSVDRPVRMLSGGQRQAVAIVRAVAWASKLVMMDEPTAALGPEQQAHVLELIRRVKEGGTPVVLISHSLQQVMEVADRIAVLRRGRLVAVVRPQETSGDELLAYITGMKVHEHYDLGDEQRFG